MKVTGSLVLIEQTMTKIPSKIILHGKNKDDGYRATFKVLQLGKDCPPDEVKVGDIPIFTKYVDFQGVKKISGKDGDDVLVIHTIVKYEEIIGVDDEQPNIEE